MAIASIIRPSSTACRMRILSSRLSKFTDGSTPDSTLNFSAASLKPSESEIEILQVNLP